METPRSRIGGMSENITDYIEMKLNVFLFLN